MFEERIPVPKIRPGRLFQPEATPSTEIRTVRFVADEPHIHMARRNPTQQTSNAIYKTLNPHILAAVAILLIAVAVMILRPHLFRSSRWGFDAADIEHNTSLTPAATHQAADSRPRHDDRSIWKKPFRLPSLLTASERDALSSDPGSFLYAHPEEELRLLSGWAMLDPDAAHDWLNTQLDAGSASSVFRGDLIAAMAAGLLGRNDKLEALHEFFRATEDDPRILPKDQGEWILRNALSCAGYAETVENALACIRESSAPSFLAIGFAMGLEEVGTRLAALDYFDATNVPLEIDWHDIRDCVAEDPATVADWSLARHPDMLESVITAWALDRSPEEAAKWLSTSGADPRLLQSVGSQLETLRLHKSRMDRTEESD